MGENIGGKVAAGAAYVVYGQSGANVASTFTSSTDLDALVTAGKAQKFSGANAQDHFGASVAIGEKELWIGAPAAEAGVGRIFRLARGKDGNFTGMAKLLVDSIPSRGAFGNAFAVSGNNAIIGMVGDGGGLGTVMFLAKSPTGAWMLKGTSFPPVVDKWDLRPRQAATTWLTRTGQPTGSLARNAAARSSASSRTGLSVWPRRG